MEIFRQSSVVRGCVSLSRLLSPSINATGWRLARRTSRGNRVLLHVLPLLDERIPRRNLLGGLARLHQATLHRAPDRRRAQPGSEARRHLDEAALREHRCLFRSGEDGRGMAIEGESVELRQIVRCSGCRMGLRSIRAREE
jgi:hypothetical protein